MALYAYEALKGDGTRVRGVIDAPSTAGVKEHLKRQGLFPVSVTLATEGAQQSWWQWLNTRGVTTKEKILFTRQLSVLVRSGTPLLQALTLLVDQFEGRMRTVLVRIKDDIKEGAALADSLEKYPKIFDTIYVQLVRAGEASGRLEQILERLTDYLEKQDKLAKQVKGALFYPMIQLIVAALVTVGLLVFVVPTMTNIIEEMGGQMPAMTRFLISVSRFTATYFWLVAGVCAAIYFGIAYWSRTPTGGRTIDRIKLKLPLIKYLTRTGAVVQFSYTLGTLLEGGVDLAQALDIVCAVVDNQILAQALQEARDKIIKEGKIADYLQQTKLFPPMAIYLIRTGEESGSLDKMLLTVAHNYEDELGELSARLTSLLGPLTLILVFIVVGFIIAAVAIPMMDIGSQFDMMDQ